MMQTSTSNESDHVEGDTNGTTPEKDETNSIENGDDKEPKGTKREFTISVRQWDSFRRKMHTTSLFTEVMPHLFVRTTNDEIGGGQMLQTCYWDEKGVLWRGQPWPASERLVSLEPGDLTRGTAFECTNAEGSGKVAIHSWDADKMDGRYWTRDVLGIIENNGYEFSKSNRAIPRCVRQLKVKTLEEMAAFFKTDLLSTLAYFCRTRLRKLNLKGYVSHLFATELGNPDESVHVAPVSRAKLEGVTLIRIDGSDYSLKTGKRVRYEPVGEVFEVVAEGGSLDRVSDDALIG